MKVIKILLLALAPIMLCNCANDQDINDDHDIDWELNYSWDITICNNDIYIAYRMNNDLYIAKSHDGTFWQKVLLHKGDLFDCTLSCANASVNLIITDYKKGLLYFNNVELSSNYETLMNIEQSSIYAYSSTLNTFGLPVVSVAKLWERNLLFFTKENDLWEVTQYRTTKNITDNLGVFFDSNNAVHDFLIIDDSFSECGEILHLYEENNTWQNEILGQCVTSAEFSADDRGVVYLIYKEYREDSPHNSYQTHYLMKTVAGWIEADFADEVRKLHDFLGGDGFIATGEGILHFFGYKSYQPSAKQTLHYLSNKNGIWEKSTIAESYSDNFGSFSFTVDDENNAHIVYCDSEDTFDTVGPVKLYYVTDKTGEWVRHEVDFSP